MAGLARRLNGFLSSRIPEKRLFLQTSGGTSYIRLTPLTQLGLGTSLVALVGWTAIATAAVVLDLRDGGVVASASVPTYDPSVWTGGISARDYDRLTRSPESSPLTDRVIAGVYPPASTFKVVSLPAAVAPGVSAPAGFGVDYAALRAMVAAVASTGRVALLDVVELNPDFDVDNRTAKAAARLIDDAVVGAKLRG